MKDNTIFLLLIYILLAAIFIFIVHFYLEFHKVIDDKYSWISVGDELPQPGEKVIGYNSVTHNWEEVSYKLEGWIRIYERQIEHPLEITHWMRIGAPE